MNQWDIQSKHVFDISGICETLYSGECRWGGGEHYVCYTANAETKENLEKGTADNTLVITDDG